MVDFKNNRRFLLRCLNKDLIPVSIKLQSTIRTPKGLNIIHKAEKALLNERIRTINNTLDMLEWQRDPCMYKLSRVLDHGAMEESKSFIICKNEARHCKTLECQKIKFKRPRRKNKGGPSNQNLYMHAYHSSKTIHSRPTATTKQDHQQHQSG